MDVAELTDRLEALIRTARAADGPGTANSRRPSGPTVPPDGEPLGTAIVRQEEMTRLFGALQLAAVRSIDALDNGDYCDDTLGQSPSQSRALATGVRYRVAYSTDIFDQDAHLEATLSAIEQGENARVSDHVPCRVLIRDGEEALVIAKGYPAAEHLGFHTTHPVAVGHVRDMFETIWTRALPVTEQRLDAVGVLTGEQIELLKYLVMGRTDASIARSLGLSTRTVQRQIQTIQLRLGARGRFQLGLRVGRLLPNLARDADHAGSAGSGMLSPEPAPR
ncbi:helix-turn-helix transcriptional regulator [Microbacterium sp. Mu-80]|uniref:Helix-turn-helix transcriptional regulator n=1 Tax=Microbacterium bandirmense TaxID=3122050 RepID=A0ABU8LBB3_9MICO